MALSEERLSADLRAAMKARDMRRVYVLRGLLAAAKHRKVEQRGADLDEAELVQLVRREVRKRTEAEEFALRAGRSDVVDENRAERAVLEAYAPPLMTEERIESLVRELAAGGANSVGAIMGALREGHAGAFDGKVASAVARRVLSERAG